MWKKWVLWRVNYEIDTMDHQDITYELESGKSFIHKEDKEGNCCIIIQIRHHFPAKSDEKSIMKLMFYFMERGIKLSKTGKLCIIWDRNGYGTENADKRLISIVKNLAGMFQDYYAERLAKVYVIHPNWFMKMMYSVVKPFISSNTQNKIKIIEKIPKLLEFFDQSSLLVEHGGTSQYQYNYNDSISKIEIENPNYTYELQDNKEQSSSDESQSEQIQQNLEVSQQQSVCDESFYSIYNNEDQFYSQTYDPQQKLEQQFEFRSVILENHSYQQNSGGLCCSKGQQCAIF